MLGIDPGIHNGYGGVLPAQSELRPDHVGSNGRHGFIKEREVQEMGFQPDESRKIGQCREGWKWNGDGKCIEAFPGIGDPSSEVLCVFCVSSVQILHLGDHIDVPLGCPGDVVLVHPLGIRGKEHQCSVNLVRSIGWQTDRIVQRCVRSVG